MSIETLLELEKKIVRYMDEVVEDEIIDVDEVVKLAKYANEITRKIDEDGIVDQDEQVVYDRVSGKLRELFLKYDIEGWMGSEINFSARSSRIFITDSPPVWVTGEAKSNIILWPKWFSLYSVEYWI